MRSRCDAPLDLTSEQEFKKKSLEKLGGKFWQPDSSLHQASHPRVYFKPFKWFDFKIKYQQNPGEAPGVRVVYSLVGGGDREVAIATWATVVGQTAYYDFGDDSWFISGLSRYLEEEFIARIEQQLQFLAENTKKAKPLALVGV